MRIIVVCFVVSFSSLVAQQQLDTIYANENKTVALFFPKPIRQGIVGNEDFVFNYNREEAQHVGLLQARPGVESNLLAITSDGFVYSYILKYADTLSKLNYFIKTAESIGSEKRDTIKMKREVMYDNKYENRSTYFEKVSDYLLKLKQERLAVKRKEGMKLVLERLVYEASEVYLVLTIENRSGIDFTVDFLNIYSIHGNSKRKASYQKLRKEVVYKQGMPTIIKSKQLRRFVYVLPKFVLGDHERLMIGVQELNGSRNIMMMTTL